MRRIAILLLGFVLAGSAAAPAAAHAVLEESLPRDGAVLAVPPAAILLRFNEPVALIALGVVGPGGRMILLPEPPQAANDRVTARLPDDLPQGSYLVSYRVTSSDSHPVAGALVFHVGAPEGRARGGAAAGANTGAAAAEFALRTLLIGVVLLAGGLALYAAVVAPLPPPLDRALPAIAVLGAVVAAASIAARGALLADLAPAELFGAQAWRVGRSTTHGLRALAAGAGLLAIAFGCALKGAPGRWVGVLGALTAAGGTVLSGHAATADPRWLAAPSLALHALGVAFWAGALWPLAIALRREPAAAAASLLRRFSRRAVPTVAVLLAAGAILAFLQLGDPWALALTTYGRVLLLKLLLVAALLLVAERNRRRLTPALAADRPGAARALIRAIRIEAVLIAGIVVAAAALGTTPPPRTLRQPTGVEAAATARDLTATVRVTPGRAGPNAVAIRLSNPRGEPASAREVAIEFANPAAGVAPIRRPARAAGPAAYQIDDAPLLASGTWQLRVDVLVSDFEKLILRMEVHIK